ncbi:hypothetical protein LCGC14_1544650 [marine sediment metagenome]|uniref:Helix-turn-helix type 11 domain-containing protein n=1 Tax=marine sediment metagenome TaxID=412755 RepID=A0A0F9IRY2_9ZZZZ
MNHAQKRVLALIEPEREDEPISLHYLALRAGIAERTVKQIIQDLRRDYHQPIGHNRNPKQSGYYMIRCPKKLREMVQKLRYEANSRHVTATALEKALSGQMELISHD